MGLLRFGWSVDEGGGKRIFLLACVKFLGKRGVGEGEEKKRERVIQGRRVIPFGPGNLLFFPFLAPNHLRPISISLAT